MRNRLTTILTLTAALNGCALMQKPVAYWYESPYLPVERIEIYYVHNIGAFCATSSKHAYACTIIEGKNARIYIPSDTPDTGRTSKKCILLHELKHAAGWIHDANNPLIFDGLC